MAGNDDKKPGEPSAYDRMSLNSLQRELENEKQKAATAREEARERIEAEAAKGRAFPWGTIVGVILGGIVVFFGLVYLLRASFPGVAELALPDWVYTPYDGGPPVARPDAGPRIVAVPDAGHAGGHHGGTHGHGTGSSSSSGTGSPPHGLDLGSTETTDDPLEGL